jgi:hypothetical protein
MVMSYRCVFSPRIPLVCCASVSAGCIAVLVARTGQGRAGRTCCSGGGLALLLGQVTGAMPCMAGSKAHILDFWLQAHVRRCPSGRRFLTAHATRSAAPRLLLCRSGSSQVATVGRPAAADLGTCSLFEAGAEAAPVLCSVRPVSARRLPGGPLPESHTPNNEGPISRYLNHKLPSINTLAAPV